MPREGLTISSAAYRVAIVVAMRIIPTKALITLFALCFALGEATGLVFGLSKED